MALWRSIRSRPVITGIVLVLLGLFFLGGGGWLIALGGTWYYALAGLGLLVCGVLLIAGHVLGFWLYWVVLAGTIGWSIYEVGFDGWKLVPRLVAPAVL